MHPIDWASKFDAFPGFVDFEVGFGRGKFITEYASAHPSVPLAGVEVRKQPVEILEERIQKLGLKNTYLIHGNAQIVLEDCFEIPLIRNCFVFHPDPWFKKCHHKRRVIQPKFLETLHSRMQRKGRLYVSTDVEALWEAMSETLEHSPYFKAIEDPEFWETQYKTNWQSWSVTDQRKTFFGVFEHS
jgi:tRNA (guanine-N7-)-methyltransferase